MSMACRITGAVLLLLACAAGHAASTRVHVYALDQQYWDVRAGDTLGEIAEALLPDSAPHRRNLMDDILRLNPGAFIDRNPDRLRANTRLWLPNAVTQPVSDPENVEIQEFSWGHIKRIE